MDINRVADICDAIMTKDDPSHLCRLTFAASSPLGPILGVLPEGGALTAQLLEDFEHDELVLRLKVQAEYGNFRVHG